MDPLTRKKERNKEMKQNSKNSKKTGRRVVGALVVMLVVVAVAGVVFAAVQTPSQILAGLTGKSETDLQAARAAGSSYGSIAAEAGVLDEFQAQRLEALKTQLAERVTAGTLDQASADSIYDRMEDRVANCDGTGVPAGQAARNGRGSMTGSASGNGLAAGTCDGTGIAAGGGGRGNGRGTGTGTGVCTVTPAIVA